MLLLLITNNRVEHLTEFIFNPTRHKKIVNFRDGTDETKSNTAKAEMQKIKRYYNINKHKTCLMPCMTSSIDMG